MKTTPNFVLPRGRVLPIDPGHRHWSAVEQLLAARDQLHTLGLLPGGHLPSRRCVLAWVAGRLVMGVGVFEHDLARDASGRLTPVVRPLAIVLEGEDDPRIIRALQQVARLQRPPSGELPRPPCSRPSRPLPTHT